MTTKIVSEKFSRQLVAERSEDFEYFDTVSCQGCSTYR